MIVAARRDSIRDDRGREGHEAAVLLGLAAFFVPDDSPVSLRAGDRGRLQGSSLGQRRGRLGGWVGGQSHGLGADAWHLGRRPTTRIEEGLVTRWGSWVGPEQGRSPVKPERSSPEWAQGIAVRSADLADVAGVVWATEGVDLVEAGQGAG